MCDVESEWERRGWKRFLPRCTRRLNDPFVAKRWGLLRCQLLRGHRSRHVAQGNHWD